jgi:hypothetical protein
MEPAMTDEKEDRTLAIAIFATETVISHVLHRISQLSNVMTAAIQEGFDDAANEIEAISIGSDKSDFIEQTFEALAIVDSLRRATLGNSAKHKDARRLN